MPSPAWVQQTAAPISGRQTEADAYTRYELLAPDTASFKIYYEITATAAGATSYYNPIRAGSTASDESVVDAMTGQPLHFEVVKGAAIRLEPRMGRADPSMDYIKVTLARPVPEGGQARMRILKTYKDGKSYYRQGDTIVFNRPLGIQRNQVILPAGYQLTNCNVPSQILLQPDGRVAISFMHAGAGDAPLILRAKLGAQTGPGAAPQRLTNTTSWEKPPAQGPGERARLAQHAIADRDIVYELQAPETHAFSLYHDYTETSPRASAYYNVVREGSTVQNPSAVILDTGEKLPAKIMTGAELKAANLNPGESVTPGAQVVVIPFTPVKAGESIRLRIFETYTAPSSYRLDGNELVFDRSFGRPRNAVVLPPGWYVTDSSIPATVTQLRDGRIRLDYWNDRPDEIDVLLKAKRLASPTVN